MGYGEIEKMIAGLEKLKVKYKRNHSSKDKYRLREVEDSIKALRKISISYLMNQEKVVSIEFFKDKHRINWQVRTTDNIYKRF